jgi:hypothetical protein
MHPKTEEELIGYTWLNLAGEAWGSYAWAGPGTWALLAQTQMGRDLLEGRDKGELGDYIWIKPPPFTVRILMNPFAEEGRIYLARAGTKYLSYVEL